MENGHFESSVNMKAFTVTNISENLIMLFNLSVYTDFFFVHSIVLSLK